MLVQRVLAGLRELLGLFPCPGSIRNSSMVQQSLLNHNRNQRSQRSHRMLEQHCSHRMLEQHRSHRMLVQLRSRMRELGLEHSSSEQRCIRSETPCGHGAWRAIRRHNHRR